jgi:hypothetical protein
MKILSEKTIELRKENKSLVENFVRRLGSSNISKITIKSKGNPNTYEGDYIKSMNSMKNLPGYIIILNGNIEEGIEDDIKYFANASSKDMNKIYSEIISRSSKYNARGIA